MRRQTEFVLEIGRDFDLKTDLQDSFFLPFLFFLA